MFGTEVTGHSGRRTGAFHYMRSGWAVRQLAHLGRWKSNAILSYAEEALEQLQHEHLGELPQQRRSTSGRRRNELIWKNWKDGKPTFARRSTSSRRQPWQKTRTRRRHWRHGSSCARTILHPCRRGSRVCRRRSSTGTWPKLLHPHLCPGEVGVWLGLLWQQLCLRQRGGRGDVPEVQGALRENAGRWVMQSRW